MIEISYMEAVIFITILWVASRIIAVIRNQEIKITREILLLLVYICIIIIIRFVYFPLHHVDGHIDILLFDASKIYPFWINFIPFVHLFDVYHGWQINIIGNIAMFIPVGIVWPSCFKKLDSIGKTVFAGFGLTLCIELSQLLFFERCSDIDDLLLNTTGVFMGASISFRNCP